MSPRPVAKVPIPAETPICALCGSAAGVSVHRVAGGVREWRVACATCGDYWVTDGLRRYLLQFPAESRHYRERLARARVAGVFPRLA
ncbi:MAG: hypothetical protein ACHQPI_04600 [Thermoanaerobaculia bacterium]